jgi:hypothetical protein
MHACISIKFVSLLQRNETEENKKKKLTVLHEPAGIAQRDNDQGLVVQFQTIPDVQRNGQPDGIVSTDGESLRK